MSPSHDANFEALYRQNMVLRGQVEQLSTLREISLAISGSLEKSDAMRLIVEVVQGALDVLCVTIYENDAENQCLRPSVAKYDRDLITADHLEEEVVPWNQPPFDEALQGRRIVVRHSEDDSEAYVPLIAQDEHLGVMLLQNRRDGLPFSQEDTRLFQLLGSQIAIAIHNAQLYALAVTDGLTKLYVRRYFDLRMQEEFALAQRHDQAFSVMLFDIDHFKKFNDAHGHQTGDAVLRQFSRLLQKNTRDSDICCRYGGEEMTIILPQTRLDEGTRLAEKLCALIREHPFVGTSDQELHVTTSIGIADSDGAWESADALVEAADQALYDAKEDGRDQVRQAASA